MHRSLGDQFARWTSEQTPLPPYPRRFQSNPFRADDVFKSTVHRAVNRSGVSRYSIPLFFGSDYDVKLEVRPRTFSARRHPPGFGRALNFACEQPLPSCVSDDYPAQYEVVTAGDYVKSRLEATYAHSKAAVEVN